jgi:RNA polymerase sigma-70 factor (ECF subfamily)
VYLALGGPEAPTSGLLGYTGVKSQVQKGRSDLRALFDKCCSFTLDSSGNLSDFSEKLSSCKNC